MKIPFSLKIKKTIFFSLCFLFVFTTCKKDEDNLTSDDNPELKYNHVNEEPTNSHEIKIHSNKRVASLKMSSNEYKSYVENEEFRESSGEKLYALLKDVYKKFKDDYDFVILVLNEIEPPAGQPYGVNMLIKNETDGIGKYIYDNSSKYGSLGKLKSIIQMYHFEGITRGPMLHEMMHNWANSALPTTMGGHWGFLGGNNKGQLGGFDQSTLIDHGGDLYTVEAFGEFANGGNGVPFTEFELYLMGMTSLSSVSPFDGFQEVSSKEYNDDYSKITFNSALKTSYTQSSIESTLGKRIPSYLDSQKDFRALVLAITPSDLSDEEWTILDNAAIDYSLTGSNENNLYNFWEATKGKGTITIGDF